MTQRTVSVRDLSAIGASVWRRNWVLSDAQAALEVIGRINRLAARNPTSLGLTFNSSGRRWSGANHLTARKRLDLRLLVAPPPGLEPGCT